MNGSSRPSLLTRWEKGICSVSSSPQQLFLTLSSWPCISEKMSVSSYESHQMILPLSSQRLPFSPIFERRILLSSSNILSASVSFSSSWLLETCRPSPSPCHPGRTFWIWLWLFPWPLHAMSCQFLLTLTLRYHSHPFLLPLLSLADVALDFWSSVDMFPESGCAVVWRLK